MKKSMRIFGMAALMLAGALTFGCDSFNEGEIVPQQNEKYVTLTTNVSFDNASTKAVDADGVKTFEVGDKMAVFIAGTTYVTEALVSTDITDNGKKAKFTVKDVENPESGQSVTYIYPASAANDNGTMNYSALETQNGLAPSQSNPVDFCQCSGELTSEAKLPAAKLTNPLTLVKFTIKVDETDITSTVTQLTVSDGTNTYTINREAAAGPIWVSMLPVSEQTISITAQAGIDSYSKEVTSKTLVASSIYPVTVKMTYDAVRHPLTFEAMVAGATVKFTPGQEYNNAPIVFGDKVQYKKITNGVEGDWRVYSPTENEGAITLTNVGDRVMFRGTLSYYSGNGFWEDHCSKFSSSEDCYIYGNVMSLVGGTEFATKTSLDNTDTFGGLFIGNTHIKNHAFKTLALPATTLSNYCYLRMFEGCTGLTTAPALPATIAKYACYESMFEGCTGLTTASNLPAETLDEACYESMFKGCINLKTLPTSLPAMTMKSNSYKYMFQGCTSITTAPNLPATQLASYCYDSMFLGCTGLTTPPTIGATNLDIHCCESMFENCTNLASLPALNATNAAAYCYYKMFKGCTALINIPSNYLPATTLEEHCYNEMFRGCTNLESAPNLGALTLKNYCYAYMFYDCTHLKYAPIISATEIDKVSTYSYCCCSFMFKNCSDMKLPTGFELKATNPTYQCYWGMFENCTSLNTAPNLPAETLVGDECYHSMFAGCTSLKYAPTISATVLTKGCYWCMFDGCSKLETAPALPVETLAELCYKAMFYDCKSLTTAPNLPATTLVKQCYEGMFCGCKLLSSVTCLATNADATNCLSNWLSFGGSTGTLYTTSFTDQTAAESFWSGKIPEGWSVILLNN